ncbi:Mg-protoporphyrin IX methyl transferase [Pirellulimonas nuda]|uniref:Mg-protoporphyrin IX methyl transferase n=1 Tax=Pirellulimonas nuda TaxID=2528009 RepID=A0A518D7F0_9BACT|nr:class I SAM-dependent methyltransferase [Pirellulimonas nuda]QDU87391.1 Mg-protoporphyrin IX methyl transferase [Pirellulimonas nuda]
MFAYNSDRHWERFGAQDPYYGVLVENDYKSANLSDESRARFFQSGATYVDSAIALVRSKLDAGFRPRSALDFGCGVGRLAIPLAGLAEQVTAIDVSPAMLEEARKNCAARGVTNVSFGVSDDSLSAAPGPFDFVHSFIVFQHISAGRGAALAREILNRLSPGGVGLLHFTYGKDSFKRHVTRFLQTRAPFGRQLINVARGRAWSYPAMQMNDYNLNRLFRMLQEEGIEDVTSRFTNHGGHLGVMLCFQKPAAAAGALPKRSAA